jgi:hypothetical protein
VKHFGVLRAESGKSAVLVVLAVDRATALSGGLIA